MPDEIIEMSRLENIANCLSSRLRFKDPSLSRKIKFIFLNSQNPLQIKIYETFSVVIEQQFLIEKNSGLYFGGN
jgi:hypothetical protein